jgi:Ca2+-binding EF-hand superfamily protein
MKRDRASGDLDKVRAVFARFDRDGSGTIDAAELGELLEEIAGGSDDRLLAALAKLKTADRLRVSWDEFQRWWGEVTVARAVPAPGAPPPLADDVDATAAPVDRRRDDRDLREAFERFDHDRRGSIDARELAQLFEALGMEPDDEELRAAFARLDADGSGRIDFEELRTWWNEQL